ncbi:MAG: FecR family protein [Micropepsaceae bacterium]
MCRAFAISLLLLSVLGLGQNARAGQDVVAQWQIIQRVGEVSATSDEYQPVALDPGAHIPEGAILQTGRNGRAVIRRGEEQIVVHAMSRLVLTDSGNDITRITQTQGSAWFKIGKRQAPHFEVDTPFLAAVVKGTSFLVTVTGERSDVQVNQGAVEVATIDRNAVTLVKPGMNAAVSYAGRSEIEVNQRGGQPRIVTSNEGGWDIAAGGEAGLAGRPSLREGQDGVDGVTAAGLDSFGTTVTVGLAHSSSNAPAGTQGTGSATSPEPGTQPSGLRGSADENGNIVNLRGSARSATTRFTSGAQLATRNMANRVSGTVKVLTNHKPLKLTASFPWTAIAVSILGLLSMMVFSQVRGLRRRTRKASSLSLE